MPDYELRVVVRDVADGDIVSLAQDIYERHGEDFDADRGDFEITVSKNGFPMDWEPLEPA